jgi:hypothetical protein
MKTTRVFVFGNAFSVPENRVIGFVVNLRSEGTIHVHYGVQHFFIDVSLIIEKTATFNKEFLLATGTDGYGCAEPFRKELFYKLYNGGFNEKIKEMVSGYLLDRFNEGNVGEDGMINLIEMLLEVESVKH